MKLPQNLTSKHGGKAGPDSGAESAREAPSGEGGVAAARGTVEDPRPSRGRGWLLGLLLAAATILAYQPAWRAGFVWDDDIYVTHNRLLTAPDGLNRIWFSLDSPSQYFPLVYTTFRIERSLWGLDPAGYHWVNILLHATNALLLWWLLGRLRLPGAWLAAAIFALHPVQVESVAWITERKNVLSLLFTLLTVRAWIQFAEAPRPAWRFYALALMFYLLALFSKTTACTLPAALLLILWLKEMPIDWRRWAQLGPFLVLGTGMGLVTVAWERYHQGLARNPFAIGALDRVLIASHAVWFYLGKLVWPTHLTFSYPRWTINLSDPLAYGWLAGLAALGGAVCFARRFVGRSVEVALLFFVATLSPLLGFFMLSTFEYSFVADHYQYAACIGPFALAAAAIAKGAGRVEKGGWFLKPALCGTLLFVLGILTWRQAGCYADADTLWRATIERNPGSFMAHNNLANDLMTKGQVDEAIAHYRKALEVQPAGATVDYNLGIALAATGQLDEAIVHFRKALELQPDGAAIAYKLANALLAKGQVDEAILCYRKALEIQPGGAAIACSLGNALSVKGRVDEAMACFTRALEISPTLARAHSGLGNVMVRKGRLAEAITEYTTALSAQPADITALANLSWVLATCSEPSLRNGSRAVELAEEAARLSNRKSPEVLKILAAAYAEAGRFPEAVATARQAMELPTVIAGSASAEEIRAEIKLYEAQAPVRDPSLTNSNPKTNAR